MCIPTRSDQNTAALNDYGSIPRIGDKAPDFTATTTQGEIVFSKWQGDNWVLLFSHPADFTPVCSTELTELARREDEFRRRSVKLIGLSVDSIHSHLAWRENLRQLMDITIEYPIIADLSTDVSRKYGMIHPGEASTATIRAVFVIDPQRLVRAMVYYPLNVGRNVDEIVRLIDALQLSDREGCACPVNWKSGEKVIVPPPKTEQEVADRLASDYERLDFYICKRQV